MSAPMPWMPLQLTCSWPLAEVAQRFDLGFLHDEAGAAGSFVARHAAALRAEGSGLWECDLATEALTWTPAVYDLFGLPRDARLMRAETLRLYAEPSRVAMERLRAHAIRHRRGFTLDAELRPVTGGTRWMRLTAAPVCRNGRAVRLRGLKRDVSSLYR